MVNHKRNWGLCCFVFGRWTIDCGCILCGSLFASSSQVSASYCYKQQTDCCTYWWGCVWITYIYRVGAVALSFFEHQRRSNLRATLCQPFWSVSKNFVSATWHPWRPERLFYRDGANDQTPFALVTHTFPAARFFPAWTGYFTKSFTPQGIKAALLSMRESTFEVFASKISKITTELAPKAKLNIYWNRNWIRCTRVVGQWSCCRDISQPPTDNKELV